jgi:CheY-like chemotaxis protein
MSNFSDVTALIIEDDQTSINVLLKLLDQLAIESVVIPDSYNIQDHMTNLPPVNVVFLDLEMPRVNGYSVLELLQTNPQFDGVPVVAYTTHTSHLNEARTAGFHSFLGKPLDSRRFPELLELILDGEQVWEIS